ncbi:hypothetical protein EV182_001959 [Spiromyces aspiralis]|uniref:Uncharacterized protein n=1 Tax=Spiromyces aspiralis TaxID=68401 RepID=A0ACC1HHH0_9FUNG|nr:hypothetical protein EV182_001959 [Spiromyces aspiralis]
MEAADISNNNHTINSSNTTTTAGGDGGDNSKSRTDGKPTSDNNSTGVSGASTADSAEVEGADEFCFICADPVEFWAEDSETVIYTRDPETLFEELAAHRYKYHDEKLGLKFEQRRIHDLTMYALQFNCPYRSCNYADESGWGNLRKHIQSEHNMYLCELCVAHKKVFPHEHRIYTKARLKHHKRDGDTKGFTGHPQCEFCHIYFYDGDELFTHCREKHEQCFICVRSGTGRQVYYKNYMTLVDHFSKEHYICKHPACLEKKFIAFETKMDLQAHIVEEHSENLIGQRAKREARRVDIEFGSAPASGNDSGTSRQEARRDGESSSKGKSNRDSERAGRKRPTGFGQLSQAPSSEPQSTQSTNGSGGGAGGSLSQQQRQQQQHSASVKLDESQWPSLAAQQLTGSQQPSPKALSPEGRTPSSVNLAQSTASASAPADFQDLLKQVSMYFNHREQPVERFQSLTSTVIKGGMTPDDYISNCWLLFLTVPRKEPKAMFNKVVQQIVRQIDDEVRKKAFLTSVANHKARQQQFPALTSVTAARQFGEITEGTGDPLITRPARATAEYEVGDYRLARPGDGSDFSGAAIIIHGGLSLVGIRLEQAAKAKRKHR